MLYKAMREALLQTPHRVSSAPLSFTELQKENWKVWHYLFLPSPRWLSLSSIFCSQRSSFCSGSYAVALASAAVLPACWGPFHWQNFLPCVGCSYHSLNFPSSHFDLHFFSTPFSPEYFNVLLFVDKTHAKASIFLPLIIFHLSGCSLNFFSLLCLLPSLPLAPQTTLWLLLFFCLFQEPLQLFLWSLKSILYMPFLLIQNNKQKTPFTSPTLYYPPPLKTNR